MKKLEEKIRKFEELRLKINKAQFEDFETNRNLFNQLKTLLIENGFDTEVITIDDRNKFFTPIKNIQTLNNPNDDFKDDQGKLAALCTKAIRILKEKQKAEENISIDNQQVKTLIKTETVYPPTSWRLIRNVLFWTIFGIVLSIFCTAFYYIGQNSKDKENADLVVKIGEKSSEIKNLKENLKKVSFELSNCQTKTKGLKKLSNASDKK